MSLASIGDDLWASDSGAQPVDKENIAQPESNEQNPKLRPPEKKLSPRWIFNAAMLSSPANLEQLVTMSRDSPGDILNEVGLLNAMVDKCLNAEKDSRKVDKDTRLDVLVILANIAKTEDDFVKEEVQRVLAGVSSWFEKYVEECEALALTSNVNKRVNPELHKAMLLLLSRAFSYSLKTENLLELCGGDRHLALESVLGILEDGEVLVTEIASAKVPLGGQRGQWEAREARIRHEKELIVQMCSLLLGFTRADTYFSELEEGFYFMEAGLELPEYCIDQFSVEIDSLLKLTMRTKLVEKLAVALNTELFSELKVLESADHDAIVAVHGFIQNLYLYGCEDTETFRAHLLSDTLLVPHVVIPYLERCVYHAAVLTRKASLNRQALQGEFEDLEDLDGVADLVAEVSDLSLDYPELCRGVEATLRTLVICSFRAPRTRLMFQLLQRFNPTASLLRMKSFVARHDYIFSLLILLNVNMGAFDITADGADEYFDQDHDDEDDEGSDDDGGDCDGPMYAYAMLSEVLDVYDLMPEEKQRRVLRRIEFSGALPIARDCPSYSAVLSLLWGGGNSNIGLLLSCADEESDEEPHEGDSNDSNDSLCQAPDFSETKNFKLSRADAKAESEAFVAERRQDAEMDALCSGGAEEEEEGGLKLNKRMAKSGTLRRKAAAGETWAASSLAEMDEDMERLDAMVAADLRACQEDMWALESEVMALKANPRQLPGDGGGGDDEEDTDEEEEEDGNGGDGDQTANASEPKVGGAGVSVAALGSRSPPSTAHGLLGSFGSAAAPSAKEEDNGSAAAEEKGEPKNDAKGEVPEETKRPSKPRSEEELVVHGSSIASVEVAEDKASPNDRSECEEKDEKEGGPPSCLTKSPAVATLAQVPTLDLNTCAAPERSQDKTAGRAQSKKDTGRRGQKKTGRGKQKTAQPEDVVQLTARSRRSLLGDLPSLQNKRHTKEDLDAFLNLKLEMPDRDHAKGGPGGGYLAGGGGGVLSPTNGRRVNNGVPEELACAINGHLMKDPVRSPSGLVFEKATILLWLTRNGSVCPITGAPLAADELTPDNEARKKIMRRHISKSMGIQEQQLPPPAEEAGGGGAGEGGEQVVPAVSGGAFADDLYDF